MTRNTLKNLIGIIVILIGIALYKYNNSSHGNLSLSAESWRYSLSDTWVRLNAPSYDWPPDSIAPLPQSEIINQYKRLGFDLHCYGQLRPEEKVGEENDYLCWFLPRKAHGNIPATMVTFFFSKNKLAMVRVQVPSNGYERLQKYFNKAFTGVYKPISEGWSFKNRGTDGEFIVGWHVKNGLLLLSAEELRGEDTIYLWIASEFAYTKKSKPAAS